MSARGAIYNEQAYALGKMLDHSSWSDDCGGRFQLPRNITPSDIDMCFDNGGRILFCELSSSTSEWLRLGRGQRLLYEAAIIRTPNCAVLCKHSVAPVSGRKIDTRYDIEQFQVAISERGRWTVSPVFMGNARWQALIETWYSKDGPVRVRRFCSVEARAA